MVDSYKGLVEALNACVDPSVNDGMQVMSVKNSFSVDADTDKALKITEGDDPSKCQVFRVSLLHSLVHSFDCDCYCCDW